MRPDLKPCALAMMLLLCPASASAQQRLSALERETMIKAIETAFEREYVFPEMRPKIVDRLEQMRKSGRYDVDDPVTFADRVTEDLRGVSNDRHLSLSLDAAAYAAALAPPTSDAGEEAYYARQTVRDHHGLAELRILPGNIRYLKISGFEWIDDGTGSAYDDAVRFLKDGDAIIIDLRGNGGGSHGAVRYLVSHFLDPRRLEMTFLEGTTTPEQSRALDHLPAGRLKGKPLYVLVNGKTASAAEAFAYDVQQFKLGELVGAKTVGAANNNKLLPIAPYFMLSVSFGRPVHAASGANWEGTGITPDTAVAPAMALDVAQLRALDRLAANPAATAAQRRDYAWARAGIEATLHPVRITTAGLKRLAGRYGKPADAAGTVAVTLRDGALWLERPGRAVAKLSPLTADLFAVEDYEILRVRLTGGTLELLWSDEVAPRLFPRQ